MKLPIGGHKLIDPRGHLTCDKNSGYMRTTRNTPADTIVAAWIMALTGVGPSMASGNHTCSGNWALLPMVPKKMSTATTAIAGAVIPTSGTVTDPFG